MRYNHIQLLSQFRQLSASLYTKGSLMKRLFLSASILLIGTGYAATGPHTPDKKLQAVTPMSDEQGGRAVTYVNDVDRITVNTFAALSPHDPKYAELIPAVFDIYRRALAADPTIVFKNEQARDIFLNSLLHLCGQQPATIKVTPAAPQTLTVDMTQGAQLNADDLADLFGGDNELPIKENDEEADARANDAAPAKAPKVIRSYAERREEMGYSHRTPGSEDDVEARSLDDLFGPLPYIKKPVMQETRQAPKPAPEKKELTELEIIIKEAQEATEKARQDTELDVALKRAQDAHDKAVREVAEVRARLEAAEREPVIVAPRPPSAEVLRLRKELEAAKKDAQDRKAAQVSKAQKALEDAEEHYEQLTAAGKKSAWQQAKAILSTVPAFFTTHKKAAVKKDFYATLNHKETEGFGARMMRYVRRGFCTSAAVGIILSMVEIGSGLRRDPTQPILGLIQNHLKNQNIKDILISGGVYAVGGSITAAIQDAISGLSAWCSGSDSRPGYVSRYVIAGITTPFTCIGSLIGYAILLYELTGGHMFLKIKGKDVGLMSAVGVLSQAIYDLSSLCYNKATELLGYGHEIEYNGRAYQWR